MIAVYSFFYSFIHIFFPKLLLEWLLQLMDWTKFQKYTGEQDMILCSHETHILEGRQTSNHYLFSSSQKNWFSVFNMTQDYPD